jgi:hypothetical protein
MNPGTQLTFAAIALLAGISAAAAADNAMSSTKTANTSPAAPSASQSSTKDTLSLSESQRQTAWEDISQQATWQKAPAGFAAKVGATVPSALITQPVPVSTSNDVPALRPYQFALLKSDKLLIVNPSDNKVAEVINR